MLYEVITMPGGVPVATVAIGKAGAKNAGYLAAQMLAVADDSLAEKVRAERQKNARITSYNVCYTKLLRFLAGNFWLKFWPGLATKGQPLILTKAI